MTSSDSAGSKVCVSGLSTITTEAHLISCFSFCGKIASIAHEGDYAEIVFANIRLFPAFPLFSQADPSRTSYSHPPPRPPSSSTAGTSTANKIKVTSDDVEIPSIANAKPVDALTHAEKEGHNIEQEDKPHSAKLAEYLAHGYTIGDQVISKAIEADNPRVAAKAAEVDEKQGLTLKGKAAMIIGSKYYNAALASPVGSKVYSFYTTAAKNVTDVHEEALGIKASRCDSPSSPAAPVNPAFGK
ncbi:hypothetical protein JCM8547_007596 [Rhodosporidiobolus lusitaniae]